MTDKLPTEFFIDPGPSPHSKMTKLAAQCPVHSIDVPPGAQSYAVFGFEAVEEALCEPSLSKQIENLPEPYRTASAQNSLLVVGNMGFADPPKHARLRKPVAQAFKPRVVERLRPLIQSVVDDLIDAIPVDKEFDLMRAFALPMPLTVICEYLGVPLKDKQRFLDWSYILSQDPFQHDADELKTASREFSDYFVDLANQRRDAPNGDLLSGLIKAQDAGEMSEDEYLSTILLLIIAGHKTVANMIGNGTYLLLRHPEQLAMLKERSELIPGAIDEILRFEGSAAWASMRVTTEDVEIGGAQVPGGSFVHLSLSSAGHDPDVYDDPGRFDIERKVPRHLAFGYGPHFCIGAPLARIQGEIAFSTLLRRLPDIELAVPADEVKWLADSSLSRGLDELPLCVSSKLPR